MRKISEDGEGSSPGWSNKIGFKPLSSLACCQGSGVVVRCTRLPHSRLPYSLGSSLPRFASYRGASRLIEALHFARGFKKSVPMKILIFFPNLKLEVGFFSTRKSFSQILQNTANVFIKLIMSKFSARSENISVALSVTLRLSLSQAFSAHYKKLCSLRGHPHITSYSILSSMLKASLFF